jgi:hypothetical protein
VTAARRIAGIARRLSYAGFVAAALFVLALYDEGYRIGVAAVALVPAGVLWLFSAALKEAADLPGRLRGAPADAAELQASLGQLSRARRGGGVFRSLWRTGRAAASARDLVVPWAPLLPLVSLPFLAATVLSAIAVPIVVLLALVTLAAYH